MKGKIMTEENLENNTLDEAQNSSEDLLEKSKESNFSKRKILQIDTFILNIALCIGYGIMFAIIPLYWMLIDRGFGFNIPFFLKHFVIAWVMIIIVLFFPLSVILNKIKIKKNYISFKLSFLLILIIFNLFPLAASISCTGRYCHGLAAIPLIFFNLYAIISALPIYFLYKLLFKYTDKDNPNNENKIQIKNY